MKRGVLLIVPLLVSACSLNPHPMILLVNPTTGQTMKCQADAPRFFWAWGVGGEVAVENCAKQYEGLGFVKSEDLKPDQRRVAALAQPLGTQLVGLNGTFSGEISGNAGGQAFGMRVTFTLVQMGDQLAGVWNTSGGTSGAMSGTLGERTISNFQAKQVNPCEGIFTGSAVVEENGSRFRGSYTGSDCRGTVAASFVVSRQ